MEAVAFAARATEHGTRRQSEREERLGIQATAKRASLVVSLCLVSIAASCSSTQRS